MQKYVSGTKCGFRPRSICTAQAMLLPIQIKWLPLKILEMGLDIDMQNIKINHTSRTNIAQLFLGGYLLCTTIVKH